MEDNTGERAVVRDHSPVSGGDPGTSPDTNRSVDAKDAMPSSGQHHDGVKVSLVERLSMLPKFLYLSGYRETGRSASCLWTPVTNHH